MSRVTLKLEEQKANTTTSQETEVVPLHYESNRYQERESCRNCGSSSVYTRVYFHERTLHARWLCYNCSLENRYREYKLLTVEAVVPLKKVKENDV